MTVQSLLHLGLDPVFVERNPRLMVGVPQMTIMQPVDTGIEDRSLLIE